MRLADLAPDLRVLYPSHNAPSISPGLLPRMADLLARVIDGEPPSSTKGDVAVYDDGDVGAHLFPARNEE